MNPDQRANLEAMVEALGKSMAQAWSYFYVLRGMHEGAKASPTATQRFPWLLDQVWRGMFDALFAKLGTLIDATASTYSLPNLITLVRRYGDAELKKLIPEAEECLSEKAGPLARIKNWRHSNIAHRTAGGSRDSFYVENQMNLTEIEGALGQLDEAINHLSWNVLAIHSDTNSAFEPLVEEGKRFFLAVANGSTRE
ncbi:hypothetical protein GCM10028796_21460 [Ramlibacter monticola]|uniref:HEPN AbiU2-like domain-containing protein n=1 Tax=Ramlibacter monticola TaxID=1926872 RepID=A0A936Z0J7_9BURK|nr:hypothetical protein [Ramlibacter monticola]MBL0392398.1 hypothetical protein [Ramlibacter monticola]